MEKDPITLLLLLLICQSCYSQVADPCKDFKELGNIESRDPSKPGFPARIDDSRLTPGWYGAPDKWELLSQDPGSVYKCGTIFPIFRLKQEGDMSTVCYKMGSFPCTSHRRIKTKMCNGREIYYLFKSIPKSGFCFSEPDPCKDFKELDNIESRSPSTPGYPLRIDDSKLTPGWYGAPGKWELLSQDPGNSNMCGTQIPIYRQSEYKGISTVCNRVKVRACYRPHEIETRMCKVNNDPCAILKPCANGGTCTLRGTGYSCACPPNFSGVNCTVCNKRMLDILFIEDVSLSIGKTRFDEMKRFQESMLNSTTISPRDDQVALMVFSSNARVVFKLNKYSNSKSDVLEAIKQQTYEDGPSSNFGDAIKMASSRVFSYSYGDRTMAANKVVMFTDGYTTSEEQEAIAASIGHLKSKAEVFVVAISAVDANSTVNLIASKPSNVFQIDSPNAVSAIQQRMKTCLVMLK